MLGRYTLGMDSWMQASTGLGASPFTFQLHVAMAAACGTTGRELLVPYTPCSSILFSIIPIEPP